MERYVISVDQSTQGTKAMMFDGAGKMICRTDLQHKQLVNKKGWVSHDLNEIYTNTVYTIKRLVEMSGISRESVACIGISNQRETTAIWDRKSGNPLDYAIVWQCSRADGIVEQLKQKGYADYIRKATGIPLSAYFPAAKMAWFLREHEHSRDICLGTIDSWLVFKLTREHAFKTDYSNASRTQLFNLETLNWDKELCRIFGIPIENLAQICYSDEIFGYTDVEGFFEEAIPICGVLGDSHAALFGQGCLYHGMTKATYGTGASLMMNIGEKPVYSRHGVVTSLAWGMQGKIDYVLEGNLNYTGAVITWLKDDVKLIESAKETEALALSANADDCTYLVPAFTGLGAPYWAEKAMASLSGMTRTTGKAEIVKAALDCIAYQITDLVKAMEMDSGFDIKELRVDGGPTKNCYLMQMQSDIASKYVQVPDVEELSGIGAAYMAGISAAIYQLDVLSSNMKRKKYTPVMDEEKRNRKYEGWKKAVYATLANSKEKGN